MANGEFSDFALVGDTKTRCKRCAKIVRVEFLAGGDNELLSADDVQWVNLPPNEKWVVKSKVTSIDRLGIEPRLKVEFDREGKHSFRVWLEEDTNNLSYSDSERKRNKKYTFSGKDSVKKHKTDKSGTLIIQSGIRVNVCGMNRFRAVASDDEGNEVKSHWLTIKRLIFVQEVLMKSTRANSWPDLISEYSTHGFEFEFLSSVVIDDLKNIDVNSSAQQAEFFDAVRAAYRPVSASFVPHLILLGKVIKLKDSITEEFSVPLAVGQTELRVTTSKTIWDIDSSPWLESAFFYKDGNRSRNGVPIECSRDPANSSNGVVANTSSVASSAGIVVVRVRCRDLTTSVGGCSFPNTNLTCAVSGDTASELIVMHEIGHHVGMVPNGSGVLPDKTPTYYEKMGHDGPHCYEGLPAPGSPTRDGTPLDIYLWRKGECLMFGTASVKKFCKNCVVAVRKTDISMGWVTL